MLISNRYTQRNWAKSCFSNAETHGLDEQIKEHCAEHSPEPSRPSSNAVSAMSLSSLPVHVLASEDPEHFSFFSVGYLSVIYLGNS